MSSRSIVLPGLVLGVIIMLPLVIPIMNVFLNVLRKLCSVYGTPWPVCFAGESLSKMMMPPDGWRCMATTCVVVGRMMAAVLMWGS